MTYRTWTLGRITLVFALALGAAAACGGSEMPSDSMGGAGGAGTGGTQPAGTGGTTTASGGSPSSEGGTAGEGGAGPVTPPPPPGEVTPCQLDVDCEEFGQVCAGFRRICVDCDDTDDCDAGEVCVRDSCEERATCEDSLDCPSIDLVCVGGGPGPGPGADQGLCLECATDADCDEEEGCSDNVCVRACASDKDCTPLGLLCDFDAGTCAECFGGAACDDGEYCSDGTCVEAVCTPGETVCFGEGISSCNEMGSGYGDVDPCFDGACEVVDGEAGCVPD